MDVRTAVISFHHSERIKSELIIGSSLLSKLTSFRGEELSGAVKMVALFLEAVSGEARIAYNTLRSESFLEADRKIGESVASVKIHDYDGANACISQALSMITTRSHEAMKVLMESRLI